jgi:uncharacterized hydrophobic protein (TIGR00271 family)
VYLFTGDVAAKQTRFWLLLVLSAAIATAGVIGDSTATVIGAVIIAPHATPIQGVGVAIAYGEGGPLLRSAAILLAAIAAVVALSAGLSLLLPQLKDLDDNSQITGRVSPTIVDLVAAATTGIAGAFAVARRDIADILPGVAIAISLVPPLAVVGITAADGDLDGALGALLLFLTNVLAIVVVAIALFSATRLEGAAHGGSGMRARPVLAVVAVGATLVTAALTLATLRTVQLANRLDAVDGIASGWASRNGERVIQSRFDGTEVVVFVEGTSDGTQDRELPALLGDAVPAGTDVVVNRVAGARREIGEVR